jgi:hypothetical protein
MLVKVLVAGVGVASSTVEVSDSLDHMLGTPEVPDRHPGSSGQPG